jgi:hypothetical protein
MIYKRKKITNIKTIYDKTNFFISFKYFFNSILKKKINKKEEKIITHFKIARLFYKFD